MQIQNPTDQKAIETNVEAAGEDVLNELPGLTPRQAVLSGDAMNTPVLIQVRERHTQHGAKSIPATARWRIVQKKRSEQPTSSESADMGWGRVNRRTRSYLTISTKDGKCCWSHCAMTTSDELSFNGYLLDMTGEVRQRQHTSLEFSKWAQPVLR